MLYRHLAANFYKRAGKEGEIMEELGVITIEEREGVADGINDESLVRVTLIVVGRRRVGSRSVCRPARVCRGRRSRLLRRMSVRLQPLRTAQIHHDACLPQHSPSQGGHKQL